LPSNSPSLAWVAFAVLALAVAGGIGGLYTHRQNQETTKKQLIEELEREIAGIREQTASFEGEFNGRIATSQLKLAVRERKLPLGPVSAGRLIPVGASSSPVVPEAGSRPVTVAENP
jgi:hypothetical protein